MLGLLFICQTSFAKGFGWDIRVTSATLMQNKALVIAVVTYGVMVNIVAGRAS